MTVHRPRIGHVSLLALAGLLLAALLTPPAQAVWPGREGAVVYAGVTPGTELKPDLTRPAGLRRFTPGVAGSRLQLTSDPSDRDPQVSPSGTLVVFSRTVRTIGEASYSGIMVAAIDGTGVRQLTDGGSPEVSDSQPTFDASGTRVIFVRGGDLYSIGLAGGSPRQITSGPARDSMPAASPSGRQIVFVRAHFPPDIPQGTTPHLYSARPDGSRLRDLTPRLAHAGPWDPDFSPSGRHIAFATEGNQLRGEIFTLRNNGGPIRRLTNRPRLTNPDAPRPYGFTNPTFSPLGDEILAVARSGTSPRLARIRLANPDRPRLVSPILLGTAPAWAPQARPSLR
jgi:Tol biopolymer transport system component